MLGGREGKGRGGMGWNGMECEVRRERESKEAGGWIGKSGEVKRGERRGGWDGSIGRPRGDGGGGVEGVGVTHD